jgi:uncharacterized protein (DUF1778 family)
MSKEYISFRAKPETLDRVRAAAKEDRRTVSQFLAILVEDAVALKVANGSRPVSDGATLR